MKNTRIPFGRLTIGAVQISLLVSAVLGIPASAHAQPQVPPCTGLAFSTEEDFLTQGPKPYDGNPIISDGDLLVLQGYPAPGPAVVCARNNLLLRQFEVRVDLGLDAVDVVDPERFIIAFSTELDDPAGRFTAGDMLTTNGGVLPNAALLALFPLPVRENLGLDGLQFIGETRAILSVLDRIKAEGRDVWDKEPKRLPDLLKELKVDIWFSTEGTGFSPQQPSFLDGDLLSAATGTIVASNGTLLPPAVPAGLPNRGVDFGLDAVAADRQGNLRSLHFSTEILFADQRPGFTDGDVLRFGNGVVITNASLVSPFEPKAKFLGLDALHFLGQRPPRDPNIQTLCGDSFAATDFNGGMVAVNGPGNGLYSPPLGAANRPTALTRPCGKFVPVDGFLPSTGVTRYRVAYRPAGDPAPAAVDDPAIPGIRTSWTLYEWDPWVPGCVATGSLTTDPRGWMDASDYLGAKLGTLTGCANSGLRLAVWDTLGLPPADRDAHFVLWLEWEDAGGLHREPLEHHLQLDNTLPVIAPYPDGLQVRLMDGTTPVPACGEAPKGASKFQVWGQFDDAYYWNFSLVLRGGVPPNTVSYGPHTYFDPDDGTPPIKNTNDTGTTPDLTTVHLRDIDMTDLGKSFVDCCYLLDLYVRDASIRNEFNGISAWDNSGSYYANTFITFAAAP